MVGVGGSRSGAGAGDGCRAVEVTRSAVGRIVGVGGIMRGTLEDGAPVVPFLWRTIWGGRVGSRRYQSLAALDNANHNVAFLIFSLLYLISSVTPAPRSIPSMLLIQPRSLLGSTVVLYRQKGPRRAILPAQTRNTTTPSEIPKLMKVVSVIAEGSRVREQGAPSSRRVWGDWESE